MSVNKLRKKKRCNTFIQQNITQPLKKKKNEIRKFTGKWKELGKILNEVNRAQKDKYGMYSLIYKYCTLTQ